MDYKICLIILICCSSVHKNWSTIWLGNNMERLNKIIYYLSTTSPSNTYIPIYLSHGYSYLSNCKIKQWLVFSLAFTPFWCFGDRTHMWCVLFYFAFHVGWVGMPFSVLSIIRTENGFGFLGCFSVNSLCSLYFKVSRQIRSETLYPIH